jgi:hypothetical protein
MLIIDYVRFSVIWTTTLSNIGEQKRVMGKKSMIDTTVEDDPTTEKKYL